MYSVVQIWDIAMYRLEKMRKAFKGALFRIEVASYNQYIYDVHTMETV